MLVFPDINIDCSTKKPHNPKLRKGFFYVELVYYIEGWLPQVGKQTKPNKQTEKPKYLARGLHAFVARSCQLFVGIKIFQPTT